MNAAMGRLLGRTVHIKVPSKLRDAPSSLLTFSQSRLYNCTHKMKWTPYVNEPIIQLIPLVGYKPSIFNFKDRSPSVKPQGRQYNINTVL